MRTLTLGGALLLIFLIGPGQAALAGDEHDLNEADAKELISKAASASSRFLNTIVALGAKVTSKDLLALPVDVPMTIVVAVMGGKELDERDLKLLAHVTPKSFMEAINPQEVQAGMHVPKHPYASIVHDEYVQDITVQVNGTTATGGVRFRAPDAYEGFLEFTAVRDASGWKVTQLVFPHSKVRTVLEDGRWQLRMPKGLSGVNPLRASQLDLPRVGTAGVVPNSRDTAVISVTRDGWIRVPGERKPLSLVELQRWLRAKANDPRLREPDGSSRIDALLDIDKTIPWCVTQWIMQTCAHPAVKIYRILFGAETLDGKRGALAAVLPKDRGLAPTSSFPESFVKHKLKVFKLERFDKPSDMRALYAALRKRHGAVRDKDIVKFEIVAPPPKGGGVPHGYVVQMVDVCLAVGARDIVFEGAAMPLGDELFSSAEALKTYIESVRKRPGVARVKLGNDREFIDAAPVNLAPVPARGLLTKRYGSGIAMTSEVIEEELEEVEEEQPLEEPVIKDGPLEDEPLSDAPFEGPANNGSIGIGGGAGGAFRGRGGARGLKSDLAKLIKAQDDAVSAALRWLAAHQSPNGGWSAAGFGTWCDGKPVSDLKKRATGNGKALYDVGVTGLALQAFLGAGYTNRGHHPFAKVVSRGLRYLKNVQDPEGCFGPRSTQQYMYCHAMGAIAMVEAYGMTGSPIFKGSAQRSLDFIALARNPYFAWRYGVKPGDNDTSITGWMLLPLHAAKLINDDARKRGRRGPLTIDETAFDGANAWLDKVTDPETGRVGYVQRGTGPARPQELVKQFPAKLSESMTAVAALARMFMGQDPKKSEVLRKGLALIASKPPVWDRSGGRLDMYYWHWGTLAMYQAGSKPFRAWQEAMATAIVAKQRMDGGACGYKGSWDPLGPWGADGGRVYSTALMALCLEVRYRYDRVRGSK